MNTEENQHPLSADTTDMALQPEAVSATLEALPEANPVAPVEAFAFEDIVSGQFDQVQDAVNALETTEPTKRVLLPEPESPKLHKVLAQAGLGSRLEMEAMIEDGRVLVNNEPAHVGQRIQRGDQIMVNGKPIQVRLDPPPLRVIAYHKPAGEIVTHDDPQNRPTVFRKLPKLYQGKWQSVGRLDLNTEGLLLFTSSGELTNKLTHPRFGLEREYAVRVLGALSNDEKQQLLDGVRLDDGMAQFGSIVDGGGEGANCWYRVTISEGRNREVRRMIESLGHAVSRLIRIRYGSMMLPKGLKRGAWMELDESDVAALMRATGMPKPEQGEGGARTPRNRRGRGNSRGRTAGRGPALPQAPGGFKGNPDRMNPDRNRGDGSGGGGGGNRGGGYNNQDRDRDDFIPRGINPEQTTTDLVTKRRGSFGGNAGGNGGGGGGQRNRGRSGNGGGNSGGSGGEPDPMRTSFGYIGQDSLNRQRRGR